MGNRGVDALVASKAAELRKRFPESTIDVLTGQVIENSELLALRGLGTLRDISHGTSYRLSRVLDLAGPLRSILGRISPFKNVMSVRLSLEGYDLAVVSGGDNLSSDYGSPKRYLYPIRLLQNAGVPVVIMAQSIGPFKADEHARDFMAVARHAKLVTVRESASLEYTTNTLGLLNVKRTADTAFLLEPSDDAVASGILRLSGIDRNKDVIGLSVSGGISFFSGVGEEQHLSALERLVLALLARTEAQVALIAHVEDPDPRNNDIRLANALLQRLNYPERVKFIRGAETSNDYKAIVSKLTFVVAERMHVAIAALSTLVPVFVIGYSIKGRGILTDSYGVDATSAELVTPVADFVSQVAPVEMIINAYERRSELKSTLAQRLPELKGRASENFSMLSTLFPQAKDAIA